MSDVLGRGIYARLAGHAPLVALLDTYRTNPAIFTDPEVPKDAGPLVEGWVTCGMQVTNEPFDSKTTTGTRPQRDIKCWTTRAKGTDRVYAIAGLVRSLLHRHALTVTGRQTVIAVVGGEIVAPSDATLFGLILPVRWTLVDA